MSSLTTQFNLKTDNSGLVGTIINSPLRVGDRFFVEILMALLVILIQSVSLAVPLIYPSILAQFKTSIILSLPQISIVLLLPLGSPLDGRES